jgi:polyisoprenoid-binding protein YceI
MAKWIIDTDHSVARFSVRHFMIANVVGLFNEISGVIQFDPPDVSHLSVEAEVAVRSLTTGHAARDEHLLSPDYFDAEKYPKMIFKGKDVKPTGKKKGRLKGDFTLRGINRPITLEFEYFGPVKSPFSGKQSIGFGASTRINREDYGMNWNEIMPEGAGVVTSREVGIHIDVEADLAAD